MLIISEKNYIRYDLMKNSLSDEQKNALKYVATSEKRGIIKAEPLSIRFVNSSDRLYNNSKMIKPIKGFEDVVIHGDKTGFAYFDKNGKELYYTVREFAEILKSSGLYQGGNIRLISWETGADGATTAMSLAEQLNVKVIAPSNVVWVMPDGTMTIGDTPNSNNGEWRVFEPKRK